MKKVHSLELGPLFRRYWIIAAWICLPVVLFAAYFLSSPSVEENAVLQPTENSAAPKVQDGSETSFSRNQEAGQTTDEVVNLEND